MAESQWFERVHEELRFFNPKAKSFLFEPDEKFYRYLNMQAPPWDRFIEDLDSDKEPSEIQWAAEAMASHIGLTQVPSLEFFYNQQSKWAPWLSTSKQTQTLGTFKSGEIQVARTERGRAHVLGSILAHELAHMYLELHRIRSESTNENEKLTDAAAVYLGFGKLMLNGYVAAQESKTEALPWGATVIKTRKLGYLDPCEIASLYEEVNDTRGVPPEDCLTNLTPEARLLVRSLVPQRNAAIKRTQVLLAKAKKRIDGALDLAKHVEDSDRLLFVLQDRINQNAANLRIRKRHASIFVEINGYIFNQGSQQLASCARKETLTLSRDVNNIRPSLKNERANKT